LCSREVCKDIFKKLRVNERIRAAEVRLIGDKGQQLGVVPLSQALEIARKRNLDLVEVAATSEPPVCRLLDYGKYKYEQDKKEREARRSQKVSLLREIRLRPKIDVHDFEAKSRTAKKLLAHGDKVKVTVRFRGREITHPEIGWKLLQRMSESLKDIAAVERQPMLQGRSMFIVLSADLKSKTKEGVQQS